MLPSNEPGEFIKNDNTPEDNSNATTVAQSAQNETEETRQQVIHDLTHGKDRASFRDSNMRFASPDAPGARLHITEKQYDELHNEMIEDLAQRGQPQIEGGNVQQEVEESNEQPSSSGNLSQEEIDRNHQEAIDRNNELNRNFNVLKGLSENAQKYFGWQNKQREEDQAREALNPKTEKEDNVPQRPLVDYSVLGQVEEPTIADSDGVSPRRMIHPFGTPNIRFGYEEMKTAIESTRFDLQNGDVYIKYYSGQKDPEGNPISKTPIIFNKEQFEAIQKAIDDQEALDSNSQANEGHRKLTQEGAQRLADMELIVDDLYGKNFKNSLSELMDEETAERYLALLARNKVTPQPEPTPEETTEPTPEEITEPIPDDSGIEQKLQDIDARLGEIDSTLEIMNGRLSETNSKIEELLQGREVSSLSQEEMVTYINLLQARVNIQNNIQENKEEKSKIVIENVVNNYLNLDQIQSQSINPQPISAVQKQEQDQNQIQSEGDSTQQQQQEQSQIQSGPELIQQQDQNQSQIQSGTDSIQQQQQDQSQIQSGQGLTQQQSQSQSQTQSTTLLDPTIPTPEPVDPTPVVDPIDPIPIPTPVTTVDPKIAELQDQLRELRGENTPEQTSALIGNELAILDEKLANTGELSDEEKIKYFNLLKQKEAIDKQLEIATAESERKRKNKEKWIKIAAGVAGAGVALATPAIGIAAVLGVTLGGRVVGKALSKWGDKLRAQSNAMKYDSRRGKTLAELGEMDKRQKRREWWANRLGEVGAVLVGGATGYGIGNMFEGIVGKDFHIGMGKEAGGVATPEVPQEPTAPEAPTPEVPTPEVPIEPTDLGGNMESWMSGNTTFKASDLGWDYTKMGWRGDNVFLTDAAGSNGVLQGNFFNELSRLVPKEKLIGQFNGDVANQFLRQAYNGMNPVDAAAKAAEIILGN